MNVQDLLGGIKIRTLEGNFKFNHHYEELDSFIGCPDEVTGAFTCTEHTMNNFEGCPKIIGTDMIVEGIEVDSSFLTTLPKKIGGTLYISLTNSVFYKMKWVKETPSSIFPSIELARAAIRKVCNCRWVEFS